MFYAAGKIVVVCEN